MTGEIRVHAQGILRQIRIAGGAIYLLIACRANQSSLPGADARAS
jgi:hypothetical protein